ncbi:RRXRR domain-containing protein [Rhabdochromatium marinum]|uniref:RRXRR domain-containing protein n=1 Tax=Rhabdochromatium marinum TaxID=48729 RepID=UPI0019086FCE|nr:RRXRR domain-containing protein [Rhabdochromatium marinum]MBK1648679.1 hypothetical protein [Rhabdochromatium marinum]
MAVFVLDQQKTPLMPCSEKRARLLLERGRAVVVRLHPFTLCLKDRIGGETQPLRLSLDPGSKTTGIALVRELECIDLETGTGEVSREISGVEYQQGELAGYEVREYLLEKWQRACRTCNQRKGRQLIEDVLSNQPERLRRLQSQAKAPLRDAAVVNATRWALFERLKATGLPVSTGSGGQTQYNRQRLGIPKTHALDAACVGQLTALHRWNIPTLTLQATGRGRYQRTHLNRFGFPRGYLMREKRVHGFQTGDRVIAEMPTGKTAGIHVGRVAVRASGRFNIQTATKSGTRDFTRHCRVVQRANGYGYSSTPTQTEEARQVG